VDASHEATAEILKLARVLRREPHALHYLRDVPASEIRALREQVTDRLFTAHGHALGRLAAASKLLPLGLVATIAEHTFGPVLSARIAGLLDPGRAIELAARLPVPFLADVAVELDPRRASELLAGIPPQRIAEITRELIRRGEYVTMGGFVGHLPHEAIAAAVDVIDDRSLLHVAFLLESKESLPALVAQVSPERLESLIDAAGSDEMRAQALELLSYLPKGGERYSRSMIRSARASAAPSR
jgi:hypothetical protein